ncbi:hypothetical protein EYF80_025842 [Liparis tanakae]|uniref:Uncharacterized protein n=1 Tax=Liparis tanakae TaxID=230148 RepID=A0A4Z2HDH9_9TELE|nr:hypothetical protein EYF80_025842 [Liparis tanakae]
MEQLAETSVNADISITTLAGLLLVSAEIWFLTRRQLFSPQDSSGSRVESASHGRRPVKAGEEAAGLMSEPPTADSDLGSVQHSSALLPPADRNRCSECGFVSSPSGSAMHRASPHRWNSIQLVWCEVCYLNTESALAIGGVPGHFSAAGQVTYFNLQLAEGINTLDPQMHACSFGRGAPQLGRPLSCGVQCNERPHQDPGDIIFILRPRVTTDRGVYGQVSEWRSRIFLQDPQRKHVRSAPESKHSLGGHSTHRELWSLLRPSSTAGAMCLFSVGAPLQSDSTELLVHLRRSELSLGFRFLSDSVI